jgi:hypothetical protein
MAWHMRRGRSPGRRWQQAHPCGEALTLPVAVVSYGDGRVSRWRLAGRRGGSAVRCGCRTRGLRARQLAGFAPSAHRRAQLPGSTRCPGTGCRLPPLAEQRGLRHRQLAPIREAVNFALNFDAAPAVPPRLPKAAPVHLDEPAGAFGLVAVGPVQGCHTGWVTAEWRSAWL